jgi:hypothetical protein
MTITGNLGTVMKESATIALEYIKANAKLMGLNPEIISNIIFIYMYRKEQHLKTGLCWYSNVDLFSLCFTEKSEEKIWQ